MSGRRDTVLVVGSLHHDIVVDAPHLPALGETVAGRHWYPKFGGKGGNQAMAARRHGAAVRMLGAVGDDAFAVPLLRALDEAGVDRTLVATLPDRPTGMSVAVTDDAGDYGAVIVSGANLSIDEAALDVESTWRGVGLLLLQNEVRETLNAAAATRAKARGVRVCLNAAPARALPAAIAAAIDILVVNAVEAEMLSGIATAGDDGAARAAAALAERHPTVLLTLGGRGVVVHAAGRAPRHLPALDVEVRGTHGAGDAFTGALGAALVAGRDLDAAVAEANEAAGRHVAGTDAT